MVNQKTLTNWILDNRAALDIHVKECLWIRTVFPGWYDLDVTLSVSDQKFSGRGSDRNADIALAKAFCEAVERSVCFSHGISSLGVAGHFLADQAMANARLEYVERKTIFEHVSHKLSLNSLSVNSHILNKYAQHGVRVELFKLFSLGTNVILCVANGLECTTTFGGILGLGASLEVEAAKQKALLECLRNVEAFLLAPSKSLSYEEFRSIPTPNGFDRQALFKDKKYFTDLMDSLTHAEQAPGLSCIGGFEQLNIRDDILSTCPLQFFRFIPSDPENIQLDFVG